VLPAATVTDLLVPSIGVAVGESIAVTVRTTDAACAASGSVTLYEQATAIASGEVLDGFGTIVLPTWLRPGPHRLFAAYAGTETHSPSETPVVSITVRD
jgi:hypothetical protein